MLNAERKRRDVVVLGASAGGVAALREVITTLPRDLGAAIALVLHRSRTAETNLARVLGWRGAIDVVEPADGEAVAPGRVYVAPRDQHLILEDDVLRLSRGPREHYTRPAIDPLFKSAAAAYGERVVGALLSGTGDDGVSGLIAISAAGGLTVVQDPKEAEYSQMPRSALLNDRVQVALALGEIADVLVALARGEAIEVPAAA